MGMVNPGGRKTATEIRSSTTFGVNRLKTASEFDSMIGWQKLAQMLLQQTQQRLTEEKQFKIAGELTEGKEPWIQVSPESIAGFYDFVPVDGTLPVDNFALVNTWREMIAQTANIPEIRQRYDFAKIFGYVMKLAGVRDLEHFALQANVNVRPDEELQEAARRGDVIPLDVGDNGAGNAGGGGQTPSTTAATVELVPQPRQVGGVGPAA